MISRWRSAVLAVLTCAAGVTPLVVSGPALAASAPSGYSCAKVPVTPVRAGQAASLEVALQGVHLTYRTVGTATTIPVPGVGLPFPGTLTLVDGGHRATLVEPGGFAGSALIQLCLVDAGGAGPAVLMGTYTGGAHCCMESALYAAPRAAAYRLILDENLHFGHPSIPYDINQGMVPQRVAGRTVLLGADGTFAYRFGCYACTPTPVHLFVLKGLRLVDVTSQETAFVAAQAASLWKAVRSSEGGPASDSALFGTLAAWVADECSIGRGAHAWSVATGLGARGLLSDARYHQAAFVKHGHYLSDLRAFLTHQGYCAGQLG